MPRPEFFKSSQFTGTTPVRFDGAPGGPFAGDTKWRGVKDFQHSTLCRAFSLSQSAFFFDLPSTVRGIGSSSGAHSSTRRLINGYVMMAGRDTPVGKLTIITGADKFRDGDPLSEREFFDLSTS
jgi:hypothetical protein